MTFNEWLQTRLNVHGAKLDPDGDFGRASVAAMKAFQKARGFAITGAATAETIAALRTDPAGKLLDVPAPHEAMPPWMAELHRRAGLVETTNKAALEAFLKAGKFLGDPTKLPWCGDAIESAMTKALPDEPVPPNPFWAQAWAKFGREVPAIVGAIGVIRWPTGAGHVGIVAGTRGKGIVLLGGNQSNMIRLSSFDKKLFIAFRWPTSHPIRQYPAIEGPTPDIGSLAETR